MKKYKYGLKATREDGTSHIRNKSNSLKVIQAQKAYAIKHVNSKIKWEIVELDK